MAKKKVQKMKVYSSFADWKKDQNLKHQKLIMLLSKLITQTAPHFTATVKWGQGCWTLDGKPKIYIHAEPDYLHFGCFAGSTLKDPESLLFGKGKHVRHVKIYTKKDIVKALIPLIQQVI